MAKIISNSIDFNQPSNTPYSVLRIAVLGAIMGVTYLLFYLILRSFLTVDLAGNIALILIAIIGTTIMIWQKMVQPLIVAISVSAALWGLAGWFDGLGWFEIISWNIILFAIAYVLFTGAIRYLRLVFSLMLIVLIVASIHIIV